MTLWQEAPHCKQPPFQVWWPWSMCGSRDIFLVYQVTSREHVFKEHCDLPILMATGRGVVEI